MHTYRCPECGNQFTTDRDLGAKLPCHVAQAWDAVIRHGATEEQKDLFVELFCDLVTDKAGCEGKMERID